MVTLYFSVFLAQLHSENLVSQSFRFAKGTAQNMLSGIRTWFYFCVYFQFNTKPATKDSLVPFLQLMSLTVTYEHMKHLLSAIKFYHEAVGEQYPDHDFDVNNTLHGLKRELSHTVFQALPITPAIMRKIFAGLDMSKPKDLALWCSYLITFFCLFRKSNSVPKSSKQMDMKRTLQRRHIRVDLAANIVYVHVTFSKTIHFGQRDLIIPIPGNQDEALDPVRHLHAFFTKCPCAPESPAFTYSTGKCITAITYSGFTTSLKQLLKKAGLNPSLYSGHSFRRGGATLLYNLGASILQIQASGDWSSQCFVRYLHISEEERLKVQALVSSAISGGVH